MTCKVHPDLENTKMQVVHTPLFLFQLRDPPQTSEQIIIHIDNLPQEFTWNNPIQIQNPKKDL